VGGSLGPFQKVTGVKITAPLPAAYISPDGQSLNLGPSHIPRRARVSITFNRRQSAKKPTLPILFKPWWAELVHIDLAILQPYRV